MDDLNHELLYESTDGVVVWFFECLWKQKTERQERAANFSGHFPKITPSVAMYYSRIRAWYFTSKARNPITNAPCVKKKRSQSLSGHEILAQFCPPGTTKNQIVSQVVSKSLDGSQQPVITYQTASELEYILFRGAIGNTSLLQQFLPPKGPSRTVKNVMLFVRWQPNYCYVERHSNRFCLSDQTKSAQERGETVEGTRNTTSSSLPVQVVTEKVKQICNSLAEHVFLVSGLHVKELDLTFKMDSDDNFVLVWCQRLFSTEREQILRMRRGEAAAAAAASSPPPPSAVVSSPHGGGSSSPTLAHDHHHPQQQGSPHSPQQHHGYPDTAGGGGGGDGVLGASTSLSLSDRTGSPQLKRDTVAMTRTKGGGGGVPSSVGSTKEGVSSDEDDTFSVGGGRRRKSKLPFNERLLRDADNCLRRLSAAAGASMPRKRRAGGGGGRTAGAIGRNRLLSAVYGVRKSVVHSTSGISGYVFEDPDDEAEEIIDDMSWGEPSQLDQALLKKASGGPYAKSDLALDAGRFGLRDAYLSSMRAPPIHVSPTTTRSSKPPSHSTTSNTSHQQQQRATDK